MEIPGIEIIEKMGSDLLTEVWKAHHTSLNRHVALKILAAEHSSDQAYTTRFLEEPRATAKLKHPNINQIYDVGEHDGIYYISTEYVEGETIAQMLKKKPGMDWKKALKIALHVAEALQYAWDTGQTAHRYLTTDNIIIDQEGVIKILNLGISKPTDPAILAGQLQSGLIKIIPHYVAPEQAKCSLNQNYRTDMYSLGAILYHMLTGQVPFGNGEPATVIEKHLLDKLPHPRDIKKTIPTGASQLITKLMMKKTKERFADWPEAIAEIKKVLAGHIVVVKQAAEGSTIAQPGEIKPQASAKPRIKASAAPKPQIKKPAPPKAQPATTRKPRIKKKTLSKPATETDTAPRIKTRIKTDRLPDTPAATQRESHEPPIPLAISIPAWAVLVLCWILIAFYQLKLPAAIPALRPPGVNTPTTGSRRADSRPTQRPRQTEHSTSEKASKTSAKEIEIGNARKMKEEQEEEYGDLVAFRSEIMNQLLTGNLKDSLRRVRNEMDYYHSPGLESFLLHLEPFMTELAKMDEVIANGFKKKISEKVIINHKGKDLLLRIASVTDDKVTCEMSSQIDGQEIARSVTFSTGSLAPKEQIKWIGPATTPEKASMKFILCMMDNDYKAAAAVAADCGMLADTFKELVESKL